MKHILCQNCRQKPMEVSYTHIQNGQREDYMLCHACANKLRMQERFAQFLNSSMFDELLSAMPQMLKEKLSGKTEQRSTPAEKVIKPLPKAKPAEPETVSILKSKILALTIDKEAAISNEDFYEAARIQKILEKLHQERERQKN